MRPSPCTTIIFTRIGTSLPLTIALCLATLIAGCSTVGSNLSGKNNSAVHSYFSVIDSVKKTQPDLASALINFPKGADLHNHLSGTVAPEDFINLGIADGNCFGPDTTDPVMYTIKTAGAPGVCGVGFKLMAEATLEEQQQLIRSFSMYQFGYNSIQAGHDQFFATFGRFNAISGAPQNMAPMLVKLLQRGHSEGVSLVETMLSFQSAEVNRLAGLLRLKYSDPASFSQSVNYPAMYDYLLSNGLKDAVLAAKADIAASTDRVNTLLACDSTTRDPACDVALNFQATVNRNASLKDGNADFAKIFTQAALSFLLNDSERKVVGVNLLSGEDAPVSMKNFTTQMMFFSYFHSRFPRSNIALHAGEITPYFVGKDNPALAEHLNASIQAGAKRLGHAVSFSYLGEQDKSNVVALMRRNNTAIEINFTSNAQILGVTGDEHPFPDYFHKYGIPTVFSTDDAGVSYAGFTDEWIYATRTYKLSYKNIVQLARSSLQYSFLPGEPLWQDVVSPKVVSQCATEIMGNANPGDPCKNFLKSSEKAGAQWRYEARLSGFDAAYGPTLRTYLGE